MKVGRKSGKRNEGGLGKREGMNFIKAHLCGSQTI